MPAALPPECQRLLDAQDGVITVRQAAAAGMTDKLVRDQVRAGRWQTLYRGVYAAFSGQPTRRAVLWGAVLRAGPDAMLSHQSAAELWGLLDGPGPVIHVTVPHGGNLGRSRNLGQVAVHQSRSAQRVRHPALSPPRTRVEETVLDLIDSARDFDQAYDWICRAIGRRRTTAARLRAALNARPRLRWRREIELALGYADAGALSVLELRYVRGVERPHALPEAVRQARVSQTSGNRYLDNLYAGYRACVEIDGAAAHPQDEQWRDKSRDRWNAAHAGIDTIRIGVPDLVDAEHRCRTAADVARWLSGRGPAVGRPCGPECPVGLLDVVPTIYGRKPRPMMAACHVGGLREPWGGWGWHRGDGWPGGARPGWGGAVGIGLGWMAGGGAQAGAPAGGARRGGVAPGRGLVATPEVAVAPVGFLGFVAGRWPRWPGWTGVVLVLAGLG